MMNMIQKIGKRFGEAVGFILGLTVLVFFEAAWKVTDIIDRWRD